MFSYIPAVIPEYDYLCRIVIVGDETGERANLINRFVDKPYNENASSIHIEDTKIITINTSQDSRFPLLTANPRCEVKALLFAPLMDLKNSPWYGSQSHTDYYRNADIIIITYDVSDADSFLDVGMHLRQIEINSRTTPIKILLGVNCHSATRLDFKDAKAYADQHNLIYLEASAQSELNVESVFLTAITQWVTEYKLPQLAKEQKKISSESKLEAMPLISETEILRKVSNSRDLDEQNGLVSEWLALGNHLHHDNWHSIRKDSLAKLREEVSHLPSSTAKMARLQIASHWSLFCKHRKMGWGDTNAVKEIKKDLKAIKILADATPSLSTLAKRAPLPNTTLPTDSKTFASSSSTIPAKRVSLPDAVISTESKAPTHKHAISSPTAPNIKDQQMLPDAVPRTSDLGFYASPPIPAPPSANADVLDTRANEANKNFF